MARNDYMRQPVDMKALSSWTGREGKVRPKQIITVPEWRARELEGYRRTSSRRMGIDGTTTEAGTPYVGPARAVRIAKGQTKGGPTVDDAHGRHDKPAQEDEHGDHDQDSGDAGQAPPDTPGEGEDAESAASQESVDATDGARELAGTEGVDLAEVHGTGAHGRVTKPDVEAYLVEREG